jgi:glycosyltransferase involved in cell wall biosynthesis
MGEASCVSNDFGRGFIMKPEVTVVIPAYNADRYIAATLDSVLNQTFSNFEAIVVDDGSVDRTVEIIKDYVAKDARIHLVVSPVNQGVSNARNLGLRKAEGEWIAFLDADDLWLPRKLELHVRHLKANPDLGLSFAQVEYMSSDGRKSGKVANLRLKQIKPQHLYYENLTCTPSNLVARRSTLEQVGGFERDLRGFEDMDLCLRISCAGWQVEGLKQVLVYYRTHPSGISAQLRTMESEWYMFNGKVMRYASWLVEQHCPRAQAIAFRYLARQSLRMRIPSAVGIDFMNRSLRSDWRLLLDQPKRTFLTLFAVYSRQCLPRFNSTL